MAAYYKAFEAETFDVPLPTGVTVAVKAWGPPDAATRVIAVHGWLENAASFDFMARALCAPQSQQGDCDGNGAGEDGSSAHASTAEVAGDGRLVKGQVRLVAIDLLGHGRSDHHPLHEYLLASFVRDVCHVRG